ncbi:IS66-like element accessory protein TnpA [Marinobacterium lacunae]|uniref:IS66-like element accessory protein TnpA n=1 Tax=Marinobacterium lacunae TaxID=1232683 RepID=UPI0005651DC2|nr:transposase [Marinobacterium lacunae]
MTTDTIRKRRRHSPEFKAAVISACLQPGASVAQVAREHELNANQVQTWIRTARQRGLQHNRLPAPNDFVKLPLYASAPSASSPAHEPSEIRIEIPTLRGSISVCWPTAAADQCARWLKELLQ